MRRAEESLMERAERWIERQELRTTSIREMHRDLFYGKGSVEPVEGFAEQLVETGILQPINDRGPRRAGRPSSPRFVVNPTSKQLAHALAREQAAKRALKRQDKAASELYTLVERLQDVLGDAHRAEKDPEARRAYARAGEHYRAMRDEIIRGVLGS